MIKRNQRLLNRLNALSDAGIVLLSYLFASWLWLDVISKDGHNVAHVAGIRSHVLIAALIYAFWTVFLLWAFRLYHTRRTLDAENYFGRVLAGNGIALLTAASALYVFRLEDFSRGVLGIYFLCSSTVLLAKRAAVRALLRYARSRGYNLKHMLVIGGGTLAQRYIQSVEKRPWLGIHVDGCIRPENGMLTQLEKRIHGAGIDEVILALEPDELDVTRDVIRICEKCGTKVSVIPFYNDVIPTRPTIDTVGKLKLIQLRTTPLDDPLNAFAKRAFDASVSFLLLVLLSPLLLGLAIAIKLSSPGPVFFKLERIGLNKKKFVMYKFRSMAMQTAAEEKKGWTVRNDPRVTGIGKILRRTSIDELPQLFNILKGDMSLVGPRPERPQFVEKFKEEIPRYMVKHQVRPGLTGWAQVNGLRGDSSIKKRIEYDIYYIENWTLGFDIKIILMTFFTGFINKNAY